MRSSIARGLPALCVVALLLAIAPFLAAQEPTSRIAQAINSNATVTLPGSLNPHAAARFEVGRLAPATPLQGVTMFFRPSSTQSAELDALLKAQQTPGSPEYHHWLTPAEYGSLFGLSRSDLAKVQGWLQSQGFNVESVAPSRNIITFSGTASQVEAAFQTQMDRYIVNGETHFANATTLSIPAALAGIVEGVRNLSDFRPRPQVRLHISPGFTSGQTGAHYLTPADVATIYDVKPAYNSGYTGSGEKIVVVGQSAIQASDIEAFQTAAGLPVRAPIPTLVPNSGTSTLVQGDEAESDLDVEYSGGMAPGATVNFVYVGNDKTKSVFDAVIYAVQQDLAPVISISYGDCETDLSSNGTNLSYYNSLESVLKQAATQGQSVVASSGDTGSTGCWGTSTLTTTQQQALAVQYPASSAYVTAVGGTEFPSTDTAVGNTTYWKSTSGTDLVDSALSYIPEQTWNDDSICSQSATQASEALCSGGGGPSALTLRPSWQTGVSGIAAGSYRLVPDISLDASNYSAPYLYCTSDTSAWSQGQQGSCTSGFRDSSTNHYVTAAGGTSFAAPIFAGLLAVLNQRMGSSGQGIAAATLYSLASNSTTYASAFHDVTSLGNNCTAGPAYCSGSALTQFMASAKYDQATGLGSIDFNNLLAVWPASSTGTGTGGGTSSGSFSLAATPVTVTQGSSGISTVTITSLNSYAGKVAFTVTGSVTNGCYAIADTNANAGSTATAALTIYTSKSACSSAGVQSFARSATTASLSHDGPLRRSIPLGGAALAGVLLLGFRRSRKAWALLGCLLAVAALSFASGCGSTTNGTGTTTSTSGTTSSDVAKGTYSLTITGTDTTSSSITASTNLTLTVQ